MKNEEIILRKEENMEKSGRCGRCGRPLKNEQSIKRGYGPGCYKKLQIEMKNIDEKLKEKILSNRNANLLRNTKTGKIYSGEDVLLKPGYVFVDGRKVADGSFELIKSYEIAG